MNYPQLKPVTCSIQKGYQQCKGILFEGNIEIVFKGAPRKLQTQIHLPLEFPMQAPMFLIFNPDEQKFQLNQIYQSCVQQNGAIMIHLQSILHWHQHKDIMQCVLELSSALSTNFPFFAKRQLPNFDAIIYEDIQRVGIPMRHDSEQQKQDLEELIIYNQILDSHEQKINTRLNKLNEDSNILRKELENYDQFIDENDGKILDVDSINDILIEGNTFSKEVIELTARLNALKDSYIFFQKAYESDKITLATLLNLTNKLASEEFQKKLLLKKYQNVIKKQFGF